MRPPRYWNTSKFHWAILSLLILVCVAIWGKIPSVTYTNVIPILTSSDTKGITINTTIKGGIPLLAVDGKFDGDVFHSGLDVTTGTITIQLPEPAHIDRIGFSPQTNITARLPKDFHIDGSHDGHEWETLQTIINADYSGAQTGKFKFFPVGTNKSFSDYRISITANSGDRFLTFSELHLEHATNNIWIKLGITSYLVIFALLIFYRQRSEEHSSNHKGIPPAAANLNLTLLFFASTIFLFIPASTYAHSPIEFGIPKWSAIIFFLAITCIFLFLLHILIKSFTIKIQEVWQTLLLCLGLLAWWQAYILGWGHGALDGSKISFTPLLYQGIHDSIFWITVIFAGWKSRKSWLKHSGLISAIFVLTQFITTATALAKSAPVPAPRTSRLEEPGTFHFSSTGRNIIIIVLDMFQSDIFNDILKTGKNPALKMFSGFTYFPDAVAPFPVTNASIPAFLTGVCYDNKTPHQEYLKKEFTEHSLFKAAKEAGYTTSIRPWIYNELYVPAFLSGPHPEEKINLKELSYQILRIYDSAFFLEAPFSIKPYIYNSGQWHISKLGIRIIYPGDTGISVPDNTKADDIRFINAFIRRARADNSSPAFKFYHLAGNHVPLDLTEQMSTELMEFNHVNSVRQGNAIISLVGRALAKLKVIGAYSNSLIFIIGDHGSGAEIHPGSGEGVTGWLARGVPMILVKQPGATGPIRIRNAPVSLLDIPATISALTPLQQNSSGENMFSIKDNARRDRHFINTFTGNLFNERFENFKDYRIIGNSWELSSWEESPTNRRNPPKK